MGLVSTIIPAFNAAPFVGETIESALAQTHRDQEIIVVDDGSTDETVAVVRSFEPRVRLLQQQNGGPAAARNAGVRVSTGDWIAFLDADDIWMPNKLERQLACSGDCGLVYTDRVNIGAAWHVTPRLSDYCALPEGDLFTVFLTGNPVTLSSLMVRRSVFEAMHGFDESAELRGVEDWEFLLRCAANGHFFALCPDALVQYRWHENQISNGHERLCNARLNVLQRAFQMPRGQGISRRIRRLAVASMWRTSAWYVGSSNRLQAARWYARSLLYEPLCWTVYKQVAKLCLGSR